MTPTIRTLQWLKKNGYIACVVEKWIPRIRKRKDAFGFGDILAFSGDLAEWSAILIQCTSASNMAARLDKINASAEAQAWLASPHRKIWLIGWGKRGGRGKRKLWRIRRLSVQHGGLFVEMT